MAYNDEQGMDITPIVKKLLRADEKVLYISFSMKYVYSSFFSLDAYPISKIKVIETDKIKTYINEFAVTKQVSYCMISLIGFYAMHVFVSGEHLQH